MALSIRTPAGHRSDLLIEIEERGTPLRIDGQNETYYVLSAAQLSQLMDLLPDDAVELEDMPSFKPRNFGLTENDLKAYELRRNARRARVDASLQKPAAVDLERRLRVLGQRSHDRAQSRPDENESEQLLQELEEAMLQNLQAVIEKAA